MIWNDLDWTGDDIHMKVSVVWATTSFVGAVEMSEESVGESMREK